MQEQTDNINLFWDLEKNQKKILEDIANLAPKLFDEVHIYERAIKSSDFSSYPRKSIIIKQHQEIIKAIDNLKT